MNNENPTEVHPLTPERWEDFETLFRTNGTCSSCWCLYWRQTRKEFSELSNESKRLQMKGLVESGVVTGLIAYIDGKPAGWVSVAPREDFSSLKRSRVLKPVDELPVWSIVCFYILGTARGKGLMQKLIRAAAEYAKGKGGHVLEAYPSEHEGKVPSGYLYMGVKQQFEKAGFVEAARRSPHHPVLRLNLDSWS